MYREHCLTKNGIILICGLSLCVQGTLLVPKTTETVIRFIPVCTGNILKPLQLKFLISVYPCVYREHSSNNPVQDSALGLSLCVQGTSAVAFQKSTRHRFIPVCTGNIICDLVEKYNIPVYPCVYRDHKQLTHRHLKQIGLSLCVQGTYH